MIQKKHCTIELSCGCNLSCRHCYLPRERATGGSMDLAAFSRFLDLLADEGFLSIAFSGDEPLLDPLLPDYIRLAKERHFLTTIKTNGTLVTPDSARRLAEAGLSCVHLSIYSADPREHDAITGSEGSHAKTMNAASLFLELKVRVRMLSPLVHPLTDLVALYELSKKLNVLWLPDPVIYAAADGRPEVATCRLTRDELRRFYSFMLDAGLYKTESLFRPEKEQYRPCGMGESGIVIDAGFRYRSCIRFTEAGDSVLETPLEALLAETARLKETLRERSACRDCELRYFCQPCPALALREDGDLYGCSSARRLIAEVVRDLYRERSTSVGSAALDELVSSFSTSRGPGVVLSGSQNSMLPSLRPGDLIRIAPPDHDRLRPGDVVVFRAGGTFVVHRLVWKKNFVVVTKGDNNPFCDKPIPLFDIVGVVEGKRSRKALWYYFFRNQLRHYTPFSIRKSIVFLKTLLKISKRKLFY